MQTPVVTANNSHFPNIFPYNAFVLSCVVSLEVEVNISLNFTWKRGNTENCHNVVPFTNPAIIETQYWQSNITVTETDPSIYCYQCRVELGMEELGDTHKSYNLTINVSGKCIC